MAINDYDGRLNDPQNDDVWEYPEPSEPCETPECQHRCCECGHIECGHANPLVQPNCCDCDCEGFKEAQ